RIFLIIALLVITVISSCSQKQEETLAIGVLLTVPEAIYQQSIQLNQAILKNNPDNITLDDRHIPHITLLHAYVQESDLPEIEQVLDGFYKTIEDDSLWAGELQYSKDKTESFASI